MGDYDVLVQNFNKAMHAFHSDEYNYAFQLSCIIAYGPDPVEGVEYDPDDLGKAFDAFKRVFEEKADFPFTYEEYMAEKEIQEGLADLGVDSKKFWHALRLLHHISDDKFDKAFKVLPSDSESILEFLQYLDSQDVTIIARKKNGRRIELSSPGAIRLIRQTLEGVKDCMSTSKSVDMTERIFISDSERISYEAQALIGLFKGLTYNIYGAQGKEYKRPMLLISRILGFSMNLENPEAMYVNAERVKDCLKKYPNPGKGGIGEFFI